MIDIEKIRTNFDFVKAETEEMVRETYRLRYNIYCLERGFEKSEDNTNGLEIDEYDVRSKHALIRHCQSNTAIGSVRLILSDKSNIKQLFPIEHYCGKKIDFNLLKHFLVPRHRIAEISRFGITKEFKRRAHEASTYSGASDFVSYEDGNATMDKRESPYIILGLIALAFSLSKKYGITHWYAVMEPTLDRLLRRFGIKFIKLGPTMEYHGLRQPMFASVHALLEEIYLVKKNLWDFIDSLDGIPDNFREASDLDLPPSYSGTTG